MLGFLNRKSEENVVVADDPKLCRQYAFDCAEMARKATNPDHKKLFGNLAQTWLNLATELERSIALLDDDQSQPEGTSGHAT
jgi:hypothetical protein